MACLTAEQILKAEDLPREKVDVPEWGGEVYVRALRGWERDAIEESCVQRDGKKTKMSLTNLRAKICAASMCDENGTQIFTQDAAVTLGQKSSAALDRVFAVAQRLSGMSDDDVEELVGN